MKDENSNSVYFPVLINLKEFPVIIIGGGDVALRKAESLLKFNGDITVLAPDICESLLELKNKNKIKILKGYYAPEHIKNFKIIFSATNDPEVNKQIYDDCKKEGKLLNVVDNPPLCDFILPANVKRGNLTISVASQGSAPFYVKEIKRKLEHLFPEYYKDLLEIAEQFRNNLMDEQIFVAPENKREAFEEFIETDWEKIFLEEGKIKAELKMKELLAKFI